VSFVKCVQHSEFLFNILGIVIQHQNCIRAEHLSRAHASAGPVLPTTLRTQLPSGLPWHEVLVKFITDEHAANIQLDGAALG